MKRLLILLFILMNLSALGQTTVTADRVVANRGFYLKDRWVDSIGVDTVMSGEIRSLPSSDAVHRMVAGRLAALQAALQISLADSTSVLRDSINALRADIGTGGGSSLPSMTGNAGKYLTTDGTTANWGTVSGSATTTTALTDVSDASPVNNTVLKYNQDSAKYVPTAVATYNLTSPTNGQLLKYQDGQWVNFTPDYGSGSSEYDSVAVNGTTQKAGFVFYPADTSLRVDWGGTTFIFKQNGGGTTTTPAGYDSDAQAYFTRAESVGTLSTTEKDAYNQLVLDLKSAALYTKFKALYPFLGASEATTGLNAIANNYTIAWYNGPTYAATGVAFNGTTQYGELNLNVYTELNATRNSLSVGYYHRTTTSNDGWAWGAAASPGDPAFQLNPNYAGNTHAYLPSNLNGIVAANGGIKGTFVLSRTADNDLRVYKDATQLGSNTAVADLDLVNYKMMIGARNLNGASNAHTATEFGIFFIASGLTPTEVATLQTHLQTFYTALGR
jgi:hypothetical protein